MSTGITTAPTIPSCLPRFRHRIRLCCSPLRLLDPQQGQGQGRGLCGHQDFLVDNVRRQRLEKIKEFFKKLDLEYLDDITSFHIEKLKAYLQEKELSKATVNRYLQILRGMFYKAIDWEMYEKINPLKK